MGGVGEFWVWGDVIEFISLGLSVDCSKRGVLKLSPGPPEGGNREKSPSLRLGERYSDC